MSYNVIMFFTLITTVDACDKTRIPSVEHTNYSISEEEDGSGFAPPGNITVIYTCEDGYRLRNPDNNKVGCEYIPTPGDKQGDLNRRVRWTSTGGIACLVDEECKLDMTICGVTNRSDIKLNCGKTGVHLKLRCS